MKRNTKKRPTIKEPLIKELNSKIITGLVTIAVSVFLVATGWLFKTVHDVEMEIIKIHAKLDKIIEDRKVSYKLKLEKSLPK